MTVVIKIGGAAIEDAGVLCLCAEAVAQLIRQGRRVAIVHGGGKTLSRTLQQMGTKSEFADGLRVTDAETRDVALMVLAGLVNKKLVAAILAAGVPALGLCGGDGKMFLASKKRDSTRDLGFVGEISSVDLQWVDAIWKQGGVPVLASVALGEDGEYYNINADEMAAACAAACKADWLFFLTDVSGVKNASGSVIPSLNTTEIEELVARSIITGGMLPKLRACNRALQQGVSRVQIQAASEARHLPGLNATGTDGTNIGGTEVIRGDQRQTSFIQQGVTFEYSTTK